MKCKVEQLLTSNPTDTTSKEKYHETHSTVDSQNNHSNTHNPHTQEQHAGGGTEENDGGLIKESAARDLGLSGEELHQLMLDVQMKLFHLKKSICESVELWNVK